MTALPFELIRNFRDCGGYATRDGRTMVRGRLYRSSQFSQATEADLARIASLGLGTIVDLRRPLERQKYPTVRWPDFSARVIEHHGIDGIDMPPHLSAMPGAGESVEAARAAMVEIYRGFPLDPMIVSLYRDFFDVLADSEAPVLVHCAAGKDRTGLICAMVQHIAGVSDEDILAHYLDTNRYYVFSDEMMEMIRHNFAAEGRSYTLGAVRTVLQVMPEYLEAAIGVIEEHHGSLDAFIENELGVDEAKKAAILERLIA